MALLDFSQQSDMLVAQRFEPLAVLRALGRGGRRKRGDSTAFRPPLFGVSASAQPASVGGAAKASPSAWTPYT